MINLLLMLIVLAFGIMVKYFSPSASIENSATYALGLIMLTGYLTGKMAKKINLPSVSGYILAGILIGPFGLELISAKNVSDIQLLNGLALSLIALNAGGEIKLSALKKNIKSIFSILLFQAIFIIIGLTTVVIFLMPFFPFFSNKSIFPNLESLIAAGLLMGIISTASAPSTTLAVIVESKIRNKYTELILSIVMLKDVFILFFFVIGMSVSRTLLGGVNFEISKLLSIFFEISSSIGCGVLIGIIIVLYLKIKKRNGIVFLLTISFFSYEIFEPLHLHPLLIMMTAGFVVENFSTRGEKLINALKQISPPVYTLFFCLVGAGIKLSYLKSFYLATLAIVLFRLIFKFAGTYTGSSFGNTDSNIKKIGWMAFVSQAGISLGMAKIIEMNLGQFGSKISTFIISVVVINEIIGPMLLKIFIDKSEKITLSEIPRDVPIENREIQIKKNIPLYETTKKRKKWYQNPLPNPFQ